jgi:hypothetical protein
LPGAQFAGMMEAHRLGEFLKWLPVGPVPGLMGAVQGQGLANELGPLGYYQAPTRTGWPTLLHDPR